MTTDREPVDRLYLRHSTDKQTNARQRLALKSFIDAGAPMYEDPATSSRILSIDRKGFQQLLDEAAVGDTIRIADAARLFRSVADVLALRPVLTRRGLHLRVQSGLLSGIDLAANDSGTTMVVNVLASVLQFQRELISENTVEGVAAAAAAGKTLGRPSALSEDQAADVVTAYREGAAVKALARQYGTSPKTIRRVLDDAGVREVPDDLSALLEGDGLDDVADDHQAADADPTVVVDVPGLVAEHLVDVADDAVREALQNGQTIRRGQGYLVRVTAPVSVHAAMIEHSATALMQSPAGRKAHRIHSERVTSVRATD
ncbi:recombinase family protein [Streptomyces caniscabiei]|uniref:recombinase family protein n=1 Tax=Streptomyces caniscabiei TaxID=2746961 RepID=UPI0029AC16A1|nr:recombinase family protein [Streptomyces caniscabiei]MDX3516107.1 recombinase family protein [Streptomyces caniscabiei]